MENLDKKSENYANKFFRSWFSIQIFDLTKVKQGKRNNSNFPLNKCLNAQHHTLSSELF